MDQDGIEHVVLGATGHIGTAVASALLRDGHRVRVLTRSGASAAAWRARGAAASVVDVSDSAALMDVLRAAGGPRVFALNPPGSVQGDVDATERSTADAIADALLSARPERVVALSTYGARAGRGIGDLGTLHHLERRLAELEAPTAVVRAGYLLSNWDGALVRAREDGELPVMLDPARPLPMVDPADVGAEAAHLLSRPDAVDGVVHVEGPTRVTPQDVADAFAAALGTAVRVRRTRPAAWREEFLAAGFSSAAADSFVGLNRLVDEERWQLEHEPVRGRTTLSSYVEDLVRRTPRT